jgi:DNA invertase Pin-like site-specific DNA recombinase
LANKLRLAVAYLRTSSAASVGADKDSDKRQRAAIEAFAKRAGFTIVEEYYDAAVSGADPVDQRPGFCEMLQRLATNGAKTIIVESPDRFARDLAVQLAGHDMLRGLGIAIIPASAPDFFTEDTPTAVLVRQVLGAIAQFEKASIVAKLAAARKRKRDREGRCEGRKPLSETRPEVVALAVACAGVGPRAGSCHCVAYRRSWRLVAFSMSLASRTRRNLWRACCGSSELRRLTYHRHKHR